MRDTIESGRGPGANIYKNNDLNTDLILDILGNSTRRKILFLLSKEPLYFNQLSKIIGIGQQSVLGRSASRLREESRRS
ncbi:MAG: hypothetical protein DA329_09315 [Candidatus Nitrosocosmicus sp.]|nr:hypothetical protein [Candidatus Nitrosocosmicus sp.]